MGKRELIALLGLSSWCLVMVVWLFLAVTWVCLRFVIVVFPDHTHLLFLLHVVTSSVIQFNKFFHPMVKSYKIIISNINETKKNEVKSWNNFSRMRNCSFRLLNVKKILSPKINLFGLHKVVGCPWQRIGHCNGIYDSHSRSIKRHKLGERVQLNCMCVIEPLRRLVIEFQCCGC